ncbi:MAG: hypothetical protein QXW71_00065 [Thermoplasmata archaeon]
MKKKLLCIACVFTTLYFISTFSYADIFDNAQRLFNDIYGKFVAMSTAAAGVGVGVGTFMKKLSMGRQDKIEMGNKVIKDSIVAWAVLNALGLILNFVGNYTR